MREISCNAIISSIKEMCIQATHYLSDDMKSALYKGVEKEESPLGRQILEQLCENLTIAGEDMIPICQDTGMAVVFVEIGQEVHITDGGLEDAINEGVRQGYVEGYLRKSVVSDPIERVNTQDNTPAIIHYSIVPGDRFRITLAPKGFGSENMSRVVVVRRACAVCIDVIDIVRRDPGILDGHVNGLCSTFTLRIRRRDVICIGGGTVSYDFTVDLSTSVFSVFQLFQDQESCTLA